MMPSGRSFFDYFFHEVRRHGQKVDVVGHALAGLHGGDVRIDEYGLDALLAQGL